MTRVLGLDYGSARCGCAVSDPSGTIVTPIEEVARPASRKGMAALAQVVREREVERVVVGLPLSLRGTDTEQTREARAFAERLSAHLQRAGAEVPVQMHDERFTTRMAQRDPDTSSHASEDSRAAAHMLESWLGATRETNSAETGPAEKRPTNDRGPVETVDGERHQDS